LPFDSTRWQKEMKDEESRMENEDTRARPPRVHGCEAAFSFILHA
jgi:hypothetical protein